MDVVNFSKPSSFSKDLLAKFSGRCTYEGNGSITRLQLRLVHDMNQCWPQEGGSLTRTCFSNAYDVTATKCHRDCLKKKKKKRHRGTIYESQFIQASLKITLVSHSSMEEIAFSIKHSFLVPFPLC